MLNVICQNSHLLSLIRSFLNEYDQCSLMCALKTDERCYNFLLKRLIIPEAQPKPQSSTGCTSGNSYFIMGGVVRTAYPIIKFGSSLGSSDSSSNLLKYYNSGYNTSINFGTSNSIPATIGNIKFSWKSSKYINLTGSKNKLDAERPARIVGLNLVGNQNTITVHPFIGLENINIVGNNLVIIFQTPKLYRNLNIIENDRLIIY